jgi:hypothetical protein
LKPPNFSDDFLRNSYFSLFHSLFDEAQGQQIAYSVNDIYAGFSVKEYAYRTFVALFYFEYHLSAGAAGRNGVIDAVTGIARGDGYCDDGFLRTLCLGSEDGGALGAESYGEGCIFLVGSDNLGAVVKTYAGSYTEV